MYHRAHSKQDPQSPVLQIQIWIFPQRQVNLMKMLNLFHGVMNLSRGVGNVVGACNQGIHTKSVIHQEIDRYHSSECSSV